MKNNRMILLGFLPLLSFVILTSCSFILLMPKSVEVLAQSQQFSNQNQFGFPPHDDIDSFIAKGNIDSVLVTSSGNWNTTGPWELIVEDGEVVNFVTNMAWFNGITGHTHDFVNLKSNDDIELSSDNTFEFDGEMDVATNGQISWDEVDSTITITNGGRTITFLVDHDQTDDHFGGQPVNGFVSSITPCSDTPGPNMEIYPPCIANTTNNIS